MEIKTLEWEYLHYYDGRNYKFTWLFTSLGVLNGNVIYVWK